MKIFLSFLQSKLSYPIPAYSFWQYYLKNGIEEAGHNWAEHPDVDWALGLVPRTTALHIKWKQDTWQKVVSWLKKNPVDLFLSYLYPEQIDTQAIKQIQQLGIPCINFFCDNVRLFKSIPKNFSVFDLNWVPEYQALSMYAKAGYPYIHLPMPAWIKLEDRITSQENFNQLTFIGSKDNLRQLLFEKIIAKNNTLPLKIYGNGWINSGSSDVFKSPDYSVPTKIKHQFVFLQKNGLSAYLRKLQNLQPDPVLSKNLQDKLQPLQSLANYQQLTAQSLVTIGINSYPSYHYPLLKPNTYSKLRDIEAPMLGACYLTEWTPGLSQLYDLGNEIESYKNADEFVYKSEWLLADALTRQKLRINGQKRALQSHSIPESLKKITNHFKSKSTI